MYRNKNCARFTSTPQKMSSLETVQALIVQNSIAAIRFEVVDIHGISHCRLVASRHFRDKAVDGASFCLRALVCDPKGDTFQGSGFLEDDDCITYPVFETFQVLVWCQSTARILVEPTIDGNLMPQFPRYVARKQLERLAEFGYSLFSSHVYEFYLVEEKTKEVVDKSYNYAATSRICKLEAFVNLLLACLPRAGVDVECIDSERAPGQIKVTYKPAFGVGSADNAHTFKTMVKEIARRNGYVATFMSKPWPDQRGSASYFCHSLWSLKEHRNMIYDSTSESNLSGVCEKWIAGILSHAQAITALMAPTVNCYSRFIPSSLAPINVSWGIENCTCAIRVKVKGPKGSLIENRIPSSGSNPYIVLAATVAAGLDGLASNIPLQAGTAGDAYEQMDFSMEFPELPTSLEQALSVLKSDAVITDALGKDFIDFYVAAKTHECELAKKASTGNDSWEEEMYFDTL
ncbi:lengsin-like [Diadema setosum]|uniref:lengsin-like n=1 Tax=Diadema setosum TaxID=31175 RepID=UPI003B3B2F2C